MGEEGFHRTHRRGLRWLVRLVVLSLSLFLLMGGPLPEYAARLIPSLSPLAMLATALAQRTWYVSLAWGLPSMLVVGLALWKGRFFCRWICPLGTLYAIPSEFSRRRRFFPWDIRGMVFWFVVFASLAGLPLILFLDPLATFTRLGTMGRGAAFIMAWVPGVLIPLMLLLSLIQPMLWCSQLCPLGYFVELIHLKRKSRKKLNQGRRDLLAGLLLGAPLALLFRHVARAVGEDMPVLPPGAENLDRFAATCIRCYACVDACISGVLTVRKKGGVAEFCLPEMDFDRTRGAFCEQYCNACMQVCPTGAIRNLTMEEKQRYKIATASIVREACLAWNERLECLACDEFCAYNAIEMRPGKDGIPLPIVNQKKCRGCGACRNICPAIRQGNAVKIEAKSRQSIIMPADDLTELGYVDVEEGFPSEGTQAQFR